MNASSVTVVSMTAFPVERQLISGYDETNYFALHIVNIAFGIYMAGVSAIRFRLMVRNTAKNSM